MKITNYFLDQIQDDWMPPMILRKPISNMMPQKIIVVNLSCLYRDNLKRTYERINKKNILRPTSLPEVADKLFLSVIEHLPLVAQQCNLDGCYFIHTFQFLTMHCKLYLFQKLTNNKKLNKGPEALHPWKFLMFQPQILINQFVVKNQSKGYLSTKRQVYLLVDC